MQTAQPNDKLSESPGCTYNRQDKDLQDHCNIAPPPKMPRGEVSRVGGKSDPEKGHVTLA